MILWRGEKQVWELSHTSQVLQLAAALSWPCAGLSTVLGELGSGQWRWLRLLCTLCALCVLHGHPAVPGWVCRAWGQAHTAPLGASLGGSHGRKPWAQELQNSYTAWVYSGYLQIALQESAPKSHLWPLWFCLNVTAPHRFLLLVQSW